MEAQTFGRQLTRWERFRWNTRIGRWMGRPLLCKLGFHRWDANHWGFGGAVIDWFCKRCEKWVGTTAMDDATTDSLERIQAAKEILGVIGGIGDTNASVG